MRYYLGNTEINQFWLGNTQINNQRLGRIYGVATGGTLTTDGDYNVHTFESDGTLTITDGELVSASILVIGGGGSGQQGSATPSFSGAGGGAGGAVYIQSTDNYQVPIGDYSITIGNSGSIGSANGGDTEFSGSSGQLYLIAKGGGTSTTSPPVTADGGCGAGGRSAIVAVGGCSTPMDGGTETQSATGGDSATYGLGNDGGSAFNCSTLGGVPAYDAYFSGGGGGGIGGAAPDASGVRGAGLSIDITGTAITYGVGGAGGSQRAVQSTTPGSGGDGGGAGASNANDGVAGIVIVRYLRPPY